MQGKLCNGGAYVKDVKQLKFTDSICESEREYVDDAILGLIAEKEKFYSPNFVNTFDMRVDCKAYMDPYVYDNCKNKLLKSHQSFIQCVYNQDILCISKEKLSKKSAEIIKRKKEKTMLSKLSTSFGIGKNTLSAARSEVKQRF